MGLRGRRRTKVALRGAQGCLGGFGHRGNLRRTAEEAGSHATAGAFVGRRGRGYDRGSWSWILRWRRRIAQEVNETFFLAFGLLLKSQQLFQGLVIVIVNGVRVRDPSLLSNWNRRIKVIRLGRWCWRRCRRRGDSGLLLCGLTRRLQQSRARTKRRESLARARSVRAGGPRLLNVVTLQIV